MNPYIFNTILTIVQFPSAFVCTIWYATKKNKLNFHIYMIYWLIISIYILFRLYFHLSYTLTSLFLHIMFYTWLQLPFYNGTAIIYNLFCLMFGWKRLPIGNNYYISPILNDTLKMYKRCFSALPHPKYSEDSSPSSEPSGPDN